MITNDGKALLRKLAGDLRAKYAGRQIIVEGDTDSQPIKQSKWATTGIWAPCARLRSSTSWSRAAAFPTARVEQARTFSDHRPVADNSTAPAASRTAAR